MPAGFVGEPHACSWEGCQVAAARLGPAGWVLQNGGLAYWVACSTCRTVGCLAWLPLHRAAGVEVEVKGLLGGHSGININEDRGEAAWGGACMSAYVCNVVCAMTGGGARLYPRPACCKPERHPAA